MEAVLLVVGSVASVAAAYFMTRNGPPQLNINLNLNPSSPPAATTEQLMMEMPREVRDFIELESEPFAQEALAQRARQFYEILGDWNAVLSELSRSLPQSIDD